LLNLPLLITYINDSNLMRNGIFMLDSDEIVLAKFINPDSGEGPFILRDC